MSWYTEKKENRRMWCCVRDMEFDLRNLESRRWWNVPGSQDPADFIMCNGQRREHSMNMDSVLEMQEAENAGKLIHAMFDPFRTKKKGWGKHIRPLLFPFLTIENDDRIAEGRGMQSMIEGFRLCSEGVGAFSHWTCTLWFCVIERKAESGDSTCDADDGILKDHLGEGW